MIYILLLDSQSLLWNYSIPFYSLPVSSFPFSSAPLNSVLSSSPPFCSVFFSLMLSYAMPCYNLICYIKLWCTDMLYYTYTIITYLSSFILKIFLLLPPCLSIILAPYLSLLLNQTFIITSLFHASLFFRFFILSFLHSSPLILILSLSPYCCSSGRISVIPDPYYVRISVIPDPYSFRISVIPDRYYDRVLSHFML